MAAPANAAVGAVLNGQWKLLRMIGEGGLAAVYEAEGLQGQGKRAIKLLHPQFQAQRGIVERFYQEAKACFSLRHAHIAGVEAYAYAEDGSPYLVMELLQGMSLDGYLSTRPPMSPEVAAPLAYAILQALSVAHARGIIHRDLKPANLFLVAQPGGEHTIKVLDFGIAKVMDLAGGMGSKTRTGAVLGTPGYMSPEQIKNAKAVDARSDLWAVGVCFYEMLTNKHPFGHADHLARMVAVLKDPATPIGQVAPHLRHWERFFDQAIAREPEQRFQSAEEMAQRIREIAQGSPARFVPDGLQTVALPVSMVSPAHDLGRATPPVALPAYTPNAPTQVAGQAPVQVAYTPAGGGGALPTQVSAARPEGTAPIIAPLPRVQIVEASGDEPASLVWWAAVLLAVGTFALGLCLGYVLAQ